MIIAISILTSKSKTVEILIKDSLITKIMTTENIEKILHYDIGIVIKMLI